MSAEIHIDDTIGAISTIALFETIELANPTAKRITIICEGMEEVVGTSIGTSRDRDDIARLGIAHSRTYCLCVKNQAIKTKK